MNGRNAFLRRSALAVLVLACAVVTAWAQGFGMDGPRRQRRPGGMGQFGEWWNNAQMVEQLGLDDVTRNDIDELVYQTQQRMIDLRAQVEKENLQMRRMLDSSDPRPLVEIEDQVDRFVTAQGGVMREEILLRARIMSLLSPEQRTQLEELHAARRREMRERAMSRQRQRSGPPPTGTPDEPPEQP